MGRDAEARGAVAGEAAHDVGAGVRAARVCGTFILICRISKQQTIEFI